MPRRQRSGALTASLLALGLVLAGCGAERGQTPPLDEPADPGGFKRTKLAKGEVVMDSPKQWTLTPRPPPGVVTIATGGAALTIWAYRVQSPIVTLADLYAAEGRLRASLRLREPKLKLTSTTPREIVGAPAIVVRAKGRLYGQDVKVRTVHIYLGGVEYVIDAYALRDDFADVDRDVFGPVIASLELGDDPPLAKSIKGAPGEGAPPTPEG